VWSLAKSIGVAMLTTPSKVETPESNELALQTRPMRALFDEKDSAVWFIVSRSRLPEITGTEERALLTFSNGGGEHVVFQGAIAPDDDRVKLKSLWNGHADIAFPKGPSDTSAALLRFVPAQASFWSGGADFISFVVHFIEAKITGEAQKVGQHGVIDTAAA
jgi:general stress protein 26